MGVYVSQSMQFSNSHQWLPGYCTGRPSRPWRVGRAPDSTILHHRLREGVVAPTVASRTWRTACWASSTGEVCKVKSRPLRKAEPVRRNPGSVPQFAAANLGGRSEKGGSSGGSNTSSALDEVKQ